MKNNYVLLHTPPQSQISSLQYYVSGPKGTANGRQRTDNVARFYYY